ncbi:MAG: uridine diphosphate-N-acetylglucosamine-binding protein YvcK [Candidatus Omnitrophica bacterium]|nr:uridine diphosphate-N-acetylglucosamine-binding protein YvcK [Candidatus Omnitrophota bacterium]
MKKVLKYFRWLYPGLRIKRWISLVMIGVLLILLSSPYIFQPNSWIRLLYIIIFTVGAGILIAGISKLIKSLIEAVYPYKERELIDIIYEKRLLSRGPKIVAVGGGTGLGSIMEGLKEYTSNITAIVAVADEGGSSGRLREEFGILPPGDIRNCLVSLAEVPQLMRDLFQYRFQEGDGIKGHSFGNLFITALTEVTGSFQEAVEESSRVLAIRGRVLPSSLDRIRLKAEYHDGSVREGEDKIPDTGKPIKTISLMPQPVGPNPEALEAIREADLVILGPGSLFTSVLPNLLIREIQQELAAKNVMKLYICNVMTQHGETDGFTAADHLEALKTHCDKNIVNCCLVNSGRLEYKLLFRYAQERSFPVIFDRERIRKMGVVAFEADVVSKSDYLRHDSFNTAKEIINIYHAYKKQWKKLKKKLL